MQEYEAGNDNDNDNDNGSWLGGEDVSHRLIDKIFQTPTLVDPGKL